MPKKSSGSGSKKAAPKNVAKSSKTKGVKAAKAKTGAKSAPKRAKKKATTKKTTAKKATAKRAVAPKGDGATATPGAGGSAPKVAAKKAAPARLRVTQMRSGIGHAEKYRRTLRALGLKHHQDHVVVNDTPSMRGMLFRVRHLVRVAAEEA